MIQLAQMYHPITATPFRGDESYREIAPCAALRPYIRCFWGTERPVVRDLIQPADEWVIPDTCMDLIFTANYTINQTSGHFCVLDQQPCRSAPKPSADTTSVFAIRFYAWTAMLFCDTDLCSGRDLTAEEFSRKIKDDLEPILFDVPGLTDKIRLAEKYLLRRLDSRRIRADLLNSIYFMINSCGRARISDVCGYASVSERQLERMVKSSTGVSPKTLSSLIRYQLLWQEMLLPRYNVQDAVEKFGYTDQSHLLNDFRRHHLMTPGQAVAFAMSDFYKTAPPPM